LKCLVEALRRAGALGEGALAAALATDGGAGGLEARPGVDAGVRGGGEDQAAAALFDGAEEGGAPGLRGDRLRQGAQERPVALDARLDQRLGAGEQRLGVLGGEPRGEILDSGQAGARLLGEATGGARLLADGRREQPRELLTLLAPRPE